MPKPAIGSWIESWLSAPRWNRYLAECANDPERAFATYEWNLDLGQAILRDIACLEVAVRNAYDRVIDARWHGSSHWLLDPRSPALAPLWRSSHGRRVDINTRNRETVSTAVARSGGTNTTSGQVIAELPLGFWRHLSDTGHEIELWRPYLCHAWPPRTTRTMVDTAMQRINETRNRAAHGEPLFGGGATSTTLVVHYDVVNLSGMLTQSIGDYIAATSTVSDIWGRRP